MSRKLMAVLTGCAIAILVGACGSSSSSTNATSPAPPAVSSTTGGSSSGGATSTSAGGGSAAGALSAEARSLATGDIPDNQVFLTYQNRVGHYSMLYPEGWALQPHGADVTITNHNNIVRVVVAPGPPASTGSVTSELNRLKATTSTLQFTAPIAMHVTSGPAIKVFYTTLSAPNPVTGKRVQLIVDRYELSHSGKRATVDLGTAKGVDNVDAYRRMINSFHWS